MNLLFEFMNNPARFLGSVSTDSSSTSSATQSVLIKPYKFGVDFLGTITTCLNNPVSSLCEASFNYDLH